MGLTQFLIVLVVVGAALFLLQRAPIDATIKLIVQVVAVVVLLIVAIRFLMPMAGMG